MGNDQTHHARVAALSIAHGSALVKLLRAHGRDAHADNVEAALNEFVEIVSMQVGQPILSQAMNWVSDEAWDGAEIDAIDAARH